MNFAHEHTDYVASTVDELQSCLDHLGPPPPGRLRVFRGQTRRYRNAGRDVLLAARYRPDQDQVNPDWVAAARTAILGQLMPVQIPREYDETWVPAILQHYGPGSYYLDVTTEPKIAIWFALNTFKSQHSEQLFYTGKVTSSVRIRWAWYQNVESTFIKCYEPVLYVFDALRWSGFGKPAHGDLVAVSDLYDGQRLLHRATRLEKQSAYLLYASPDAFFGPDLGYLARTTIRLIGDFREHLSLFRSIRDVFPLPTNDPCYAVLLALPMNGSGDSREDTLPLEVPCYVSGHPPPADEVDEFISRLHIKYAI